MPPCFPHSLPIAPSARAIQGQRSAEEDPFAGLEHTAPPANGHARNGKANGGGYGRPLSPERERTITRLSLISSAARFFAGRPDATEVDVLEAAMRWEVWASATATFRVGGVAFTGH